MINHADVMVRVKKETYRKLKQRATKEERSVKIVATKAIEHYVKNVKFK